MHSFKKHLELLGASVLLAAACSGDGGTSLSGTRADGLSVTCEPTSTGGGDDIYECTPDDGDDRCEGFDEGGSALVLWPPNHKLVTVSLDDCAAFSDDCPIEVAPSTQSQLDAHITSITADESIDVGRGGDGSTKDYDMRIVDDTTIEVRSERQGGGDGRVYRVSYETAEGVAGSCEIHVPHDQGPFGGAVDSGEAVRTLR
jgi:hypothetical protein